MDTTRIADLKRRLQADPTSIAFAQLAEEFRRARLFDEAVSVCREGLRRHPGYLSARITLGRALAELGQAADAEREFEYVLRSAPDNVPALRGLAEIHEKQGNLPRALGFYRRALELARHDPELDETVRAIADELDGSRTRSADEGLSFEQARKELLDAPSRVPLVPPKTRVDFEHVLQSLGYEPDAPAPPIVEAWLSGQAPTPPPNAEPPTEEAKEPRAPLGPDLLAELEHELRQLEPRPPAAALSPEEPSAGEEEGEGVRPHGSFSSTEGIMLAELERWLVAIDARRHARAARRDDEGSAAHA